MPRLHDRQVELAVAPVAVEYCPVEHAMHDALDTALTPVRYEPGKHRVHIVEPACEEKVPALQARQVLLAEPVLYLPGEHKSHCVAARDDCCEPGEHLMQTVDADVDV